MPACNFVIMIRLESDTAKCLVLIVKRSQLHKYCEDICFLYYNVLLVALARQLYLVMLLVKAVNKLAEIMNRKEVTSRGTRNKVSESELRKKEKECRKLEQELKQV